EGDQEAVDGEPRQPPLRPAAEQLGKRHDQACSRDQPVDGPVAAGRGVRDLRRNPDEQARDGGSDKRHGSTCQAVHVTTSGRFLPRRANRNRAYRLSRRASKRAEYNSSENSSTARPASAGQTSSTTRISASRATRRAPWS